MRLHFFRHFYWTESTRVIPVNLKIGYESTVLSRGETRENPSVHFPRKPPRMQQECVARKLSAKVGAHKTFYERKRIKVVKVGKQEAGVKLVDFLYHLSTGRERHNRRLDSLVETDSRSFQGAGYGTSTVVYVL
jgi:hypothetical protein